MINLSIRSYSIEIDGLDCTKALISFTGSDSKIDQGGLITFSGQIVLGRPFGFESIDDRINDRWARGNPITVKIADDDGELRLPPRGGTLFILDSFYDPNAKKLTIDCGDILELLRFKESGAGDGAKICLGSVASRTFVINDLLAAAGCPGLKEGDTIPGTLNAPAPRLVEGSYIDQLGAMAAAGCCLIYVDTEGFIRSKPLNIPDAVGAPTIYVGWGQVAGVERVKGDRPPCKLVIKGKTTIVTRNGDETETVTDEYGPVVLVGIPSGGASWTQPAAEILIRRTIKRDYLIRDSHIRKVETTIEEPEGLVFAGDKTFAGSTRLIVSSYRDETYTYEADKPVKGTSADSKCAQGNQGRLLMHQADIWEPRGVALRDQIATIPAQYKPDRVTLILSRQEFTSYEYDLGIVTQAAFGFTDPDNPAPEPLGDGPRITTHKKQVIGAIVPREFRYGQLVNGSPEEIVSVDYQTEEWYEPRLREWNYTRSRRQSLVNVASQAASAIRKEYATSPYLIQLLTHLVPSEYEQTISNSGQAQPPAPDTYPPEFTTTEKTWKVEKALPANSSSPYRQSTRILNFDYLSSASGAGQVEAQNLVNLWSKLLWGRYKCTSYKTELREQWWSYTPLDRINVQEPEYEFAYLGDGFSIALAGMRCLIGFDGLYLGQWVSKIPNPDYTGDDPDDPEATIAVTPYVLAPYRQVLQAKASSASAVQVTLQTTSNFYRALELASVSTLDLIPINFPNAYIGREFAHASTLNLNARGLIHKFSDELAHASAVQIFRSLRTAEFAHASAVYAQSLKRPRGMAHASTVRTAYRNVAAP